MEVDPAALVGSPSATRTVGRRAPNPHRSVANRCIVRTGQLAVDVGQHQLVALDAVPDPALLDQQRSHACPCPDLRAGRTAATTAPSSSSLNCPSPPSRTSPAA